MARKTSPAVESAVRAIATGIKCLELDLAEAGAAIERFASVAQEATIEDELRAQGPRQMWTPTER